jgi:hypothetical protein
VDKGETVYSDKIESEPGNYNWSVRFDFTDGFVGIDQDKDHVLCRVLLSKTQVRELIAFVKRCEGKR